MDHEAPTQPPGTVRPATVADAQAIGEIRVLSWQKAYAGMLPEDFLRRLSVEAAAQMWTDVLGGPDRSGTVLVVESAGCERHLAGFAAFGPRRDYAGSEAGELYALYLHPRHWGRGLGAQLHGAVIDALVEDGYRTAVLWVLAANERAKAFYVRQGWVPDGATKTDPVDGGAVTLEEMRFRRTLR